MLGTSLRDYFVIRAFRGDRLQYFLELPFRVYLQRLMCQSLDILLRFIQYKTPHHLESAVQIHSAHQGFERVSQNRGPLTAAARFFTTTHHQVSTQTDVDGVNF